MIEFIAENGPRILRALTEIVGAFAIIATMTPNETDNTLADWLMKIINFFGANVGKAKNAD